MPCVFAIEVTKERRPRELKSKCKCRGVACRGVACRGVRLQKW